MYIYIYIYIYILYNASPFNLGGNLGVFYTYFYNHARRLRLEKPLYLDRAF
jgi:hypothetical protein